MATKKMTKAQMVSHFAEKFDMPKTQASAIVDEYATLATSEVKKVGEFTMPGIGKLVKSKRKARTGRNPATGESIKIPAKTVAKFRMSKTCKDSIVPPKK